MSPAKNFMMTGASPPRRPPAPALTPARARAGLMLWMTGSGINIFTIMFTGMAMINPLKSIAGVHTQFARFSDNGKVDLTQQKFQFVALNLVCLGVALYKVRRPHPRPSAAAADPPPGAAAVPRDGAAADDGVGLGDVRDGVEGARPALRPLPPRPLATPGRVGASSSRAGGTPRSRRTIAAARIRND